MSEAVYVVQVQRANEDGVWDDIETVTVPARTHRKTVIEKALDQAAITLGPSAMIVRVLDEGSARESRVESEQPPPRLKIG
jgi:hypothetical protein